MYMCDIAVQPYRLSCEGHITKNTNKSNLQGIFGFSQLSKLLQMTLNPLRVTSENECISVAK